MDKWEKVVRLHRLMANSRYCVSLAGILDELECSEATFHRIRGYMVGRLNAPLVYDRRHGGYRYDQSGGSRFELPGIWLTARETEALLLFDHAVESLQHGLMADLLGPIRARLEASLRKRGVRTRLLCKRIRILNIGAREADPGVFRVLMRGVIRRRRVEIRHQGLGDAQPAVRVISPQKLVRYRDNWYVDAFCHLRNDLRTFAINRIDGVRLVQGRFRGVREPQQEAYYGRAYGIFTGPAPHTAEIEFRGTAAREVSREGWHPKQRAEWTHEGCYRLRIPYGQDRELIMDILRWGEEAEVIGPPRLRARVKEALRGALIRYGK